MTLLPIPKGVILSGRLCIIHSLCKEDTLDTNNITVPISLYEYLSPLAPSLPHRRRRSLLVRVRWEDVPFPLRISLGTCLVRASSAGERGRGGLRWFCSGKLWEHLSYMSSALLFGKAGPCYFLNPSELLQTKECQVMLMDAQKDRDGKRLKSWNDE